MSDHEVPQNDKPKDVDDVVGSANEGLDAAAAARAEVSGTDSVTNAVDPDLAAFEAAERDHPGTFEAPAVAAAVPTSDADAARETPADADTPASAASDAPSGAESPASESAAQWPAAEPAAQWPAAEPAASWPSTEPDVFDAAAASAASAPIIAPTVADTAYAAEATATPVADTQIVPAEPSAPPPAAPQPIFVQAPEPPRELGNRGAAGLIGLVATVAFAILYLGAILGLGALAGDVTGRNVGNAALAPLTTWSFWVPVAVFFLSFWLLGAFINRARWGKWVIFGLFVAAATYGGHLLGQLFQAPFWRLTATESANLVNEQLLAPLAIAAFLFARELTIWFGAWVARSGAHKKVLNAEAQAEYERTLEAGPGALR